MQGSYIEISSAGKMQAVAPALESAKQFVAKDENIYTWQLEMRVFSK